MSHRKQVRPRETKWFAEILQRTESSPGFHRHPQRPSLSLRKSRRVQWTRHKLFPYFLLSISFLPTAVCTESLCSIALAFYFNAVTTVCLSLNPKSSAFLPLNLWSHIPFLFTKMCQKQLFPSTTFLSPAENFPRLRGKEMGFCLTSPKETRATTQGCTYTCVP